MKVNFERLKNEAGHLGKPEWRPVLLALAELHEKSIQPPRNGFPYEWEHLGPGYYYGPAFGHWDLIQTLFDSIDVEPEHTRRQILNDLHWQLDNGFLAGAIWLAGGTVSYSTEVTHPPLWPFAVEKYCQVVGCNDFRTEVLPNLLRQIQWFESNRKIESGGFFYTDVTGDRKWESGVDDGVRFTPHPGIIPCIDATSHVFALYDFAAKWSVTEEFQDKAEKLRSFIQTRLFSEETGFFHDAGGNLHFTFEGFWPLVCGAATVNQANRVIDEWLLDPQRFFTQHPVPSVAKCDPAFELRMWRGPSWNSMTMWVLRGCMRYGRIDAVRKVAERVLDAVALQFERTGEIWEFYHPDLGNQSTLARKPYNQEPDLPCTGYLGHNPLFAIARLWEKAGKLEK